ncbi:hypothetical protein AgCh_015319 [Apium graveolens]
MESPPTSGTTFVQAEPSNFRALVQKLTGPSKLSSSNHKLQAEPFRALVQKLTGASEDSSSNHKLQAEPSNFRALVQKLTGASEDSSSNHKLQAEPSNFRALVQKLTGPSNLSSSNHKLPVTYSTRVSLGPKIPPFKLQERRQSRKKLETHLQIVPAAEHPNPAPANHITSSSPVQNRMFTSNGNGSTLDFAAAQRILISPRTAMSREESEKRGIAEKGYYLHPTPPGCRRSEPPELLTLFPLHHSSST